MELLKDVIKKRESGILDMRLTDLLASYQREYMDNRNVYRDIENIRRENNERLGR